MKNYLIRRNNHYCLHLPKFHNGIKHLSFTINLDGSCIYPINDGSVNKVFGVSWGHHLDNSFRIGWNYKDGHIKIYSYIHNKGVIYTEFLDNIAPGCNVLINVRFNRQQDAIIITWGEEEFKIVDFKFPQIDFGYYLYPYFGGIPRAPHDINIKIEQHEPIKIHS